jgi:hypothetical protein
MEISVEFVLQYIHASADVALGKVKPFAVDAFYGKNAVQTQFGAAVIMARHPADQSQCPRVASLQLAHSFGRIAAGFAYFSTCAVTDYIDRAHVRCYTQ